MSERVRMVAGRCDGSAVDGPADEAGRSLAANPRLGQWLSFAQDGVVRLHTGKVDIGQGITHALALIAAAELGVRPAQVVPQRVRTGASPDEGFTAGSMSINQSGAAVRHVCALARELAARRVAQLSGVAATDLVVADGAFLGPDGRPAGTYWSVWTDDLAEVDARQALPPDRTMPRRGRGVADPGRPDLLGKVLGQPSFVHDLQLPRMLHGRVVRPAGVRATLLEVDTEAVSLRDGEQIFRNGSFLGVVAAAEYRAVRLAQQLTAHARWSTPESLPDEARLGEFLRTAPSTSSTHVSGPAESGAAEGADGLRSVELSFSRPFVAHASIGPSCAVARWTGDRLEVWSHTQGPFPLARALARTFDLPEEQVTVEHAEGAGCYGHNGADDVALDAALLARAAERPVRVVWSRADELGWSPFGCAAEVDVRAEYTADGDIRRWDFAVWSNGHVSRPGFHPTAPNLLAAEYVADPPPVPVALALDPAVPTSDMVHRHGFPPYRHDRATVTTHVLDVMPIRTSTLRALGATTNVFAVESVIDEIAAACGIDPVTYRLERLLDPRARAVLAAVADLAGWFGRPPPPEGRGRGVGVSRHSPHGAYVAVVAEVEASDHIDVTRLRIAVDAGRVVSHSGLRNQIEGGAVQTTSWALTEAVRFDTRRVTSTDWESYPIIRFGQVPVIELAVLDNDHPSLGAGEATQGPVTAAIGNAISAAIGFRVRGLPFTTDRIARAMAAE